jgi:hypothetical protein
MCYCIVAVSKSKLPGGKNMHRKMTISLDEAVYEGMYRVIGRRHMSKFIENLVRPYVMDTSLDEGYFAMASDGEREAEASEWCDALVSDAYAQ